MEKAQIQYKYIEHRLTYTLHRGFLVNEAERKKRR